MARRDWTREELIVAFNLYCRIPFGRIHLRNPEVIDLAKLIGRTPSAVSWKLVNFASLDPDLQKRGIRGAGHGSRADKTIWDEFSNDWDSLAFESQKLAVKLEGKRLDDLVSPDEFPEGRTRAAVVKLRVNQGFFRSAVVAAYNCRCCITGLSVPDLLIASHIIPWAKDEKNRTNPRNGLLLNAVHDCAFDSGLITVTPEMRVVACKEIQSRASSTDPVLQSLLLDYHGASITPPERFTPDPEFLSFHNRVIFRDRT
jgi:putative restriction endonuclease